MTISKVEESLSDVGGYDVYDNGVPFHYYEGMPRTQRVIEIKEKMDEFLKSNKLKTKSQRQKEMEESQKKFSEAKEKLMAEREEESKKSIQSLAKAIVSGDEDAIIKALSQ